MAAVKSKSVNPVNAVSTFNVVPLLLKFVPAVYSPDKSTVGLLAPLTVAVKVPDDKPNPVA